MENLQNTSLDNSPVKLDSLPDFERGFKPACEVRIGIFDTRTILSAGDSPFFVEIFSFWTTMQVPDAFNPSFLSVAAIFFSFLCILFFVSNIQYAGKRRRKNQCRAQQKSTLFACLDLKFRFLFLVQEI